MYKIILFTILSIISHSLFSQVEVGDYLYDNLEFRNAIKIYEKSGPLTESQSKKLGLSYFFVGDYANADSILSKLVNTSDFTIQDKLAYAEVLKNTGDFKRAKLYVNQYLTSFPEDAYAKNLSKSIDFLNRRKAEVAPEFKVTNMNTVNSGAADFFYYPLENGFLFLSEDTESKEGAEIESNDSIMLMDIKLDYGTTARPLSKLYYYEDGLGKVEIMTGEEKFHFGAFDIDEDSKTIYFTRTDLTKKWDKFKEISKIFKGKIDLENYKISEIEALNIEDFGKKNPVGHPSLSADKKMMYFSGNNKNSLGGFDIYVGEFSEKGLVEVENLGNRVNTDADEFFPHIQDSIFLYFASDGHSGYGNLDIIKTELKGYNKPYQPSVLHEPINSPGDDFAISFDRSGSKKGYISSNRFGGNGDDDLFQFSSLIKLITGIVKDLEGNPRNGVLVQLLDKEGNVVMETLTDENGRYIFEVPYGEYEILIKTEDGLIAREKVLIDENWDDSKQLNIDLKVDTRLVQGIVTDENGNPVEGALVKAVDKNGNEVAQMYTDKDGKYAFEVPVNKEYDIIVTTNGHVARDQIKVGENWDESQMINMRLKKGNTVQGVVYNMDGTPSANTEISIYNENGGLIQKSKTAITDNHGRYQFDLEKDKNYQLIARKEGFKGVENIYTGDNWNSYRDMDITLYPVNVTGYSHITDRTSGKGVEDVKIILTDKETGRKFVTATDENGYFEIDFAKEREYILKIEKEGYYPRTIEIQANQGIPDRLDLSTLFDMSMEYSGYNVKNIYFKYGSARITSDSKKQLKKIIGVFKEKKNADIHVKSYADCRGSDEGNKKLTDARSRSVEKYLNKYGVPKDRIITKSMGATNFVNNCVRPDDCTESEHALNRRSEFEIIERK